MSKMRALRPVHFLLVCMVAMASSLLLLATGCGSVKMGTPTVTLSASPTTIAPGASSTLTVSATSANTVKVTGSDGSSYTMAASGGTQVVKPTATTTYTATATPLNADGSSVTATATVTVSGSTVTNPAITNFSANPTTVAAGGSSTLSVATTNATAVTIAGSDGSSYTVTLTNGAGTQSVTPTATTTYTATATGATGTTAATATATVTVGAAANPTVTLTANPTSVLVGGSSTLTVQATNATTVTITPAGGTPTTVPLTNGTGTLSVTPSVTTTYTATATGASGTTPATATATVTVTAAIAPPTVSIAVAPTTILRGASATLTVTAQNASLVTISGTDGSSYTLAAGGGTQTVTPTTTTTYEATATGPVGTTPATASVTLTVTQPPAPTVSISANPTTIVTGGSSLLTIKATNATTVTVTGTDGTNQTLSDPSGGTVTVSPTTTTSSTTYTYTATATGVAGTATATATVVVGPAGTVQSIEHVIFMLQENHSFDNYEGMLNPYRASQTTNGQPWNQGDDGTIYTIDGIDDKLNAISNTGKGFNGGAAPVIKPYKFTSTCVDDMSSAWEESFWDVNGSFAANRNITMTGFAGNAAGFAQSCQASGGCSGTFNDVNGYRAMGYYDQGFFNYYYYMASQFAVSDRWFSPVSSKTIDNRIATFSGGTTQGLVNDPSQDDHLPQLPAQSYNNGAWSSTGIPNIFQRLDQAGVSWKIYYQVNNGLCQSDDDCQATGGTALFPATTFSYFSYSYKYLYGNPQKNPDGSYNPAGCAAPTSPSSAVGDSTNSFCIDTDHIAPISTYYTDLTNGTLPSFSFIEAGFGNNDEHPGSGQSVMMGQTRVSQIVNALMGSPEWGSSVFFLAYDEDGGPYDHVPPVPGHSNDNFKYSDLSPAQVAAQKALYPDIGGGTVNGTTYNNVAVAPDSYAPCVPPIDPTTGLPVPTLHCDLTKTNEPGTAGTTLNTSGATSDVVTEQGFGAQIGFRVPNMVISPFVKRHYVSHIPMDHTAIMKFVEDRFIGNGKYMTNRDANQPNLLDFFNFNNAPWETPPTPPVPGGVGSSCTPNSMGN